MLLSSTPKAAFSANSQNYCSRSTRRTHIVPQKAKNKLNYLPATSRQRLPNKYSRSSFFLVPLALFCISVLLIPTLVRTQASDADQLDSDDFFEFDAQDSDDFPSKQNKPQRQQQQQHSTKSSQQQTAQHLNPSSTGKPPFKQESQDKSHPERASVDDSDKSYSSNKQSKDTNFPKKTSYSSKSHRDTQSTKSEAEEAKIKRSEDDDLKLINAPLPKIYTWESYYIELGFLVIAVLFFVNYFIGSSKNDQIAKTWYDHNKGLLAEQFALVGGPPKYNDGRKTTDDHQDQFVYNKKQRGLVKISDSNFTLWNSGRAGLDGMLADVCLLKRQDLFSMALTLLRPAQDTVNLRFALSQDGYENFVLCIASKALIQKVSTDLVDVNTFCAKRKPIAAFGVESERLFVMSEINDATQYLLDKNVAAFLKKYQYLINYIHITDRFCTTDNMEDIPRAQKLSSAKRMATFSFVIPDSQINAIQDDSRENPTSTEMIAFSFAFIDRLRKLKLSKDGKQKSEKNRQRITEILQKTASTLKQEAAQAKKEALRRAEKEKILNENDPEKQRRFELKEAKMDKKKSRNSKKIKMVTMR